MTFTDDDLKWWKENMRSVKSYALLARLEAAENLIFCDDSQDYDALLDVWRKAAGK